MSGSLTVDRMTVGDAMHTGIVACDVHAPLGAVARMMAAHESTASSCGTVRWSGRTQAPVWASSPTSTSSASWQQTPSAAGRRAKRRNSGSCRRRARLRSGGGRLMADNDVTHLVVVNHAAKPVGVFSTLDVAQAVSDAVHVPR